MIISFKGSMCLIKIIINPAEIKSINSLTISVFGKVNDIRFLLSRTQKNNENKVAKTLEIIIFFLIKKVIVHNPTQQTKRG